MAWRFDWITSWDHVWRADFVSPWHRWILESPTSHVFFHPALVRAWVDTYLPLRRMEPRVLVATQNGCTVFLPMVLWRKNWKNAFQRVLIPVGYSDYDYHDPIIVGRSDSEVWREFWDAFLQEVCKTWGKECDAVQLPGVHEAVARSDRFVDQGELCPRRDLGGFKDGEAFLASLRPSLRGDIRRQERRMLELGEITHIVFSADEVAEAVDSLGEFLKVHAARWPAAYKAPGFHHNLIRHGLPAGVVHFSLLKVGRDIVAWRLDFVDQRCFYAYMPAYRPEYMNLSPGSILQYYCIREAIQRRLKVFDHLRGEESYKAGWADSADRLCVLHPTMNSLGSVLRNASADRIKPALIKLIRHRQGHGHA
jgi:CelD/BcsL family acetyltransferase involved in cellulose biosynthesis